MTRSAVIAVLSACMRQWETPNTELLEPFEVDNLAAVFEHQLARLRGLALRDRAAVERSRQCSLLDGAR